MNRPGQPGPATSVKRPMRALFMLLALVACLLPQLPATPAAAASSSPFYYYAGLPAGPVGVARPALSMRVVVAQNLDPAQLHFELELDGHAVPATYGGGFITYTPSAPLASGTHQVSLDLSLQGWRAQTSWSFTVLAQPRRVQPSAVLSTMVLRAVNGFRVAAGLTPLVSNGALNSAAQAHAEYYVQNLDRYSGISLEVHRENPDWPGFTGQNPWDRAAYFGYPGNAAENLAFGRGPVGAIDTWMDSVYHRFAILDATERSAGFALAGDPAADSTLPAADLELGDWNQGGVSVPAGLIVTYPVAGQKQVPLSFASGEVPDPLAGFEGADYPVGYPVTLQFSSLHVLAVDVSAATLTTGDQPVEAYVLAPDQNQDANSASPALEHLGNAVAIIPKEPLHPSSTYHAHVEGRYQDDAGTWHTFVRDWTFRTARWDLPQEKTVLRSWSQGTISAVKVVCAADVSQAQVFVDGKPVPQLFHPSDTTLLFTLPPGEYDSSSALDVVQPNGLEEEWVGFLGDTTAVVPGGDDWTAVDLTLDGRSLPSGAAQSGGKVFLPVPLVDSVGLHQEQTTGGLMLWTDGHGHWIGAAQPGRAVAYFPTAGESSGISRTYLSLPPRMAAGTVYVPLDLARKLLQSVGQYVAADASGVRVYAWLSDIDGHWAELAVRDLASRGIVNGYVDGLFHPSRVLSRGAYIKMLVAALNLPLRPGDTGGLSVPANHWLVQQGWLGAAVEGGIVDPAAYANGLDADGPLSRLEMIQLMGTWLQAAGIQLATGAVGSETAPSGSETGPSEAAPFTDVGSLSPDDQALLQALQAAGLIKGVPTADGLAFQPQRSMTRAEAATVVERLMKLKDQLAASEEADQPGAAAGSAG